MAKNLGWRAAIVGAVVIIALVYLIPSMTSDLPEWWIGVLPEKEIQLGLDLQGGMHLVLDVKAMEAIKSNLERDVEKLRQDLRESRLRYRKLRRQGNDRIAVTLMRQQDKKTFEEIVKANYPDYEVKSVGASQEGSPVYHLILKPQVRRKIEDMAVDQAVQTIRNRVDEFGVSEPDIRPQEDSRILVQLPGIAEPQRAKDLIGRTARLEFKLVDDEHSVEDALKGDVPIGDEILYQETVDPETGRRKKIPYLVKKRSVLTGEYLTDASVQIDNRYNEPFVSISFDARGARLFERITENNVGERLAIVLDNKVYSAPVIREKIAGGKAQITGRFSMEEARDLAIVLRAGALPAPVEIIEERTVGPSLGEDSIEKGFRSMVIGGILVVIFMAVYYSLSGLIADTVLLLNVFLILAGLAFFGATLTLPGIAGIILTIGMSVDANVLIFERIREETRLGKTPRASIEGGFSKALVTILDANITTLIAALVLFQFGSGPVRGFAVTLSLGILTSLFTAIFVSRIIFDYLYVQRRMKKLRI